MDWQKPAYIGGIIVLSMVLLFKWTEFKEARETISSGVQEQQTETSAASVSVDNNDATSTQKEFIAPPETESSNTNPSTKKTTANTIQVKTDVFDLSINLEGGDIHKLDLTQYKLKLGGDKPITLLDDTSGTMYISQSGLIGSNATDTTAGRPTFTADKNEYILTDGSDSLTVDIKLTQNNINITKRFEFKRSDYLIHVSYLIDNQSAEPWQAKMFGRIVRDNHEPPAAADSGIGVHPYLGAATTSTENKYEELKFDDIEKKNKEFNYEGGWVAMVQHYFISAWIPKQSDTNEYKISKGKKYFLLTYTSPEYTVDSGQQGVIESSFYAGPKNMDRLEAISENLDLTLDFSFLWWIAKPLFHLLDFLHTYIGNWGWSIIVLTIIIKAIFFYPSAVSYRSMAKMRKVSPKMKEIKDRFGDDRQKMSQEMMKLYKKEKVNPMGGCLPIIIQMPVFISLYWVLMESVELRHAPFMFWVQDLSVKDPFFIFPVLMGITMFIQQKLNPTPPDPMQAKVMQWMPIGFTFMFLWFPAGLVIYWVTNNTLSIIQQYIITRNIEKAG